LFVSLRGPIDGFTKCSRLYAKDSTAKCVVRSRAPRGVYHIGRERVLFQDRFEASPVIGINDNDELRWLGLEPFDMIGGFNENDGPTLVNFCAANHEYHIVTCTSEDRYVNRYVPGQRTYRLATG